MEIINPNMLVEDAPTGCHCQIGFCDRQGGSLCPFAAVDDCKR